MDALKSRSNVGKKKDVGSLSIVKKLSAKRKALASKDDDSVAHEAGESAKKEAKEQANGKEY